MRPERAQERGASWSRNFVNPKYFFFCLSLCSQLFFLFFFFVSLFRFKSTHCVLEICIINVSTFFFKFFYIFSVVLFSLDICRNLCPHKISLFSLLLCLFFFAFVLSAGF